MRDVERPASLHSRRRLEMAQSGNDMGEPPCSRPPKPNAMTISPKTQNPQSRRYSESANGQKVGAWKVYGDINPSGDTVPGSRVGGVRKVTDSSCAGDYVDAVSHPSGKGRKDPPLPR